MTRKKILVTGREGQVARSLLARAENHPDIEIVILGRPEIDLGEPDTIVSPLKAIRPDLIVSAAAYTAVDQAESEEDLARRVNGDAPGVLAQAAAELGIPILQISTDYVFDGSKTGAYVEDDPVSPLGAYGRSKLAGELAVAAATDNHVILRTAWVYSPYGKNFLKTMLRLGADRDLIKVVADQYGTPTSAHDIADAVLTVAGNVLQSGDPALRGTFHLTNAGRASWAEFAEAIFETSKIQGGPFCNVEHIPSSAYPTPAQRPANSQLDCSKLADKHGVSMPNWREAVKPVVKQVLKTV
ncbi:dTDP-4-dehydrorhamnose reductase [Pararhizobium gei]|uniref:dTDP-4-dehydrorhamnose reductase n=1 Tax=Pararhizobium gei TaxID=1395951 RepID=UPI0023DC00C4|nr:dTDP-4-dehydrorhamnose reductase [Rhizobium gei]